MRRLGVDPGARRVGLALSEPNMGVACPHRTIRHRDLRQAAVLVAEEICANSVEQVVMGLPLREDGTEGDAAQRVREFAQLVQQLSSIPVVLWDERLTTAAAERSLSEAQVYGARRRNVVDQAAATLILQSYLDSLAAQRPADEKSLEEPNADQKPPANPIRKAEKGRTSGTSKRARTSRKSTKGKGDREAGEPKAGRKARNRSGKARGRPR